MKLFFQYIAKLGLLLLAVSCSDTAADLPTTKLFTEVPTALSGITFQNEILESEQLHYYKYQYMYIGGGVAVADFDNDGMEDVFLTSNIYHNKLFRNKGDLEFEDITISAGIEKRVGFDVGVSVADINNDGFLDIYINRAGWFDDNKRLANMLYINNGDLTFTENAEQYGLADANRSIASTFFDYDKDGDLDLYIANAPKDFTLTSKVLDLGEIQQDSATEKYKGSDKLYQNNGNGTFSDVSAEAGILPEIGFGLNPQVGDLNNDGWPDIYVSNDFITPDFAYVNNGDGTFSEKRNELFKHIAYYSMGSDIADINNDGLSDLMVLDMSPEDYIRSKTTMSMMPIDRFYNMAENDYHYQYMHNILQLNNGNNTFSEIGNMAGISKTDWSWATLLADFDLDGFNDAYVTNGIYRDIVDRDTNIEIDNYIDDNKDNLVEKDFYEFTQKLPQHKLLNYFFKNQGNLTFENTSGQWADAKPTFSNGAAYADFDNDGDLDLIVNNLDENATLLRNNARQNTTNNYLQLQFKGAKLNPFGVGVSCKIKEADGTIQVRELINNRGYLSSVSNKLHFGLGDFESIPLLEIIWPDGKTQTIKNVQANQSLVVAYNDAIEPIVEDLKASKTILAEVPFDIFHSEEFYNDFDKQLLLPHKLSQTGPAYAKADVNNNGYDDIFIGGAHKQSAQLLLASEEGYKALNLPDFHADSDYEDVASCFFDADNDGDQDLYVVSGSYEFEENSQMHQDRLYLNNGIGVFTKSESSLPSINSAGSVVTASDYDNDGDMDLFVGSRVVSGKYPYAPKNYLLINTNGKFRINTTALAPDLEYIGMVTSAVWDDIDDDDDIDLIVTGEWMGIEVFLNTNGHLAQDSKYQRLSDTKGWWNTLLVADIDKNGKKDIVAGNLGLNYKFHASVEEPFHVYTDDFDENGVEDIVLAKYYNEKQVPVRGKGCTSQQMPFLKEKFKKYNDFANADIQEIFGENIQTSLHYQATEFKSGIFYQNSQEAFNFKPFLIQAQIAPINSIVYEDFDLDGVKDLLMAGNNYTSEVETTRADSGIGAYLKGKENGGLEYLNNTETGFFADKDVRGLLFLSAKDGSRRLFVANNNSRQQLFILPNLAN